MCAGPHSTATVNQTKPVNFSEVARKQGGLLPDITDEALQERRRAQILMLRQGRGRRSTFLTGPLGDAPAKKTVLGGY